MFYLGLGDVLRGLGDGVEAVRGEGHDGPAPGDLEAVVLGDRAVEAGLGAALRPGETLQFMRSVNKIYRWHFVSTSLDITYLQFLDDRDNLLILFYF